MSKWLNKEIKRAKKEVKRCKKQYPDWKDNEYNSGPLKFIWGISTQDLPASFYTLNDLDICYNRDTKKYLLGLETLYKFDSIKDTISYLDSLLKEFAHYICLNYKPENYDKSNLYAYNMGEIFLGDTVEELYWKFYLFVEGFKKINGGEYL